MDKLTAVTMSLLENESLSRLKEWHGIGPVQRAEIEQLIEMVVQECAAIALREDHDPSECILKRFGVKR